MLEGHLIRYIGLGLAVAAPGSADSWQGSVGEDIYLKGDCVVGLVLNRRCISLLSTSVGLLEPPLLSTCPAAKPAGFTLALLPFLFPLPPPPPGPFFARHVSVGG